MTIDECYAEMGEDFSEVLRRLGSDRIISKFVLRFLGDDSYEKLCKAVERGDVSAAFLASHTLKGISQNLGFSKLYRECDDVCERFRNGTGCEPGSLCGVEQAYEATAAAIRMYRDAL